MVGKFRRCKQCGKPIDTHLRTFCSMKCKADFMRKENCESINNGDEKRCPICSEPIPDRRTYCSRECSYEGHSLKYGGENHWLSKSKRMCIICDRPMNHENEKYCSRECQSIAFEKTKPRCKICGKSTKTMSRKYCSRECFLTDAREVHKHRIKERPKCKICGKRVKEPKRRFCSRECAGVWQGLHQVGPNNPNWKGDWTKYAHKYGTNEWKNIRRRILRRDDYTCRICSKRGRGLDIHHIFDIDSNPELYVEDSNLVSLCRSCHRKVEGTEWGIERVVFPKYGGLSNEASREV